MSKRTRFHATVDETTIHSIHRLCEERGTHSVGRVVDFLVMHYRKTKNIESNELAERIAARVVQKLNEETAKK